MKITLAIAALMLSTVAAYAECHQVCTQRGYTTTCRQVCTGWPGTGSNDYRKIEVPHMQLAACQTVCNRVPGGNGQQVCDTHCY